MDDFLHVHGSSWQGSLTGADHRKRDVVGQEGGGGSTPDSILTHLLYYFLFFFASSLPYNSSCSRFQEMLNYSLKPSYDYQVIIIVEPELRHSFLFQAGIIAREWSWLLDLMEQFNFLRNTTVIALFTFVPCSLTRGLFRSPKPHEQQWRRDSPLWPGMHKKCAVWVSGSILDCRFWFCMLLFVSHFS